MQGLGLDSAMRHGMERNHARLLTPCDEADCLMAQRVQGMGGCGGVSSLQAWDGADSGLWTGWGETQWLGGGGLTRWWT